MAVKTSRFVALGFVVSSLVACGSGAATPGEDGAISLADARSNADSSAVEDSGAREDSAAVEDGGAREDSGISTTDSGAPMEAPVVIDARDIPADAALYTLDRTRFGVREVGRAIERALSVSPRPDNVIVYVHGRACGGGGEPDKSLGGAMPELARDYSSAPIMLFWPGSDDSCPLGFPEERARASGPALAAVLGDLYNYRLANRASLTGVRFTLVTHSMGSLVLEAASSVGGVASIPASAFETMVINAGASAANGHAAWLSRVTLSAQRFVTVNNGDNVLTAAGIGRGTRLGKSVASVPLTPAWDYVDFSANDVNHAYYLVSGQRGAGMTAFYQRVMNGLAVDFSTASGVGTNSTRDGANVHVFNGR